MIAQFGSCTGSSMTRHDRIEEALIEASARFARPAPFRLRPRGASVSPTPNRALQQLANYDEAAAQVRLERADLQILSIIVRDGANEFMRNARLAVTGIADHENRLTFAVEYVMPGLVQNLQLHLAADERRQLRFGAQLPARAAPPDLDHFKEPLVLRVFR